MDKAVNRERENITPVTTIPNSRCGVDVTDTRRGFAVYPHERPSSCAIQIRICAGALIPTRSAKNKHSSRRN